MAAVIPVPQTTHDVLLTCLRVLTPVKVAGPVPRLVTCTCVRVLLSRHENTIAAELFNRLLV